MKKIGNLKSKDEIYKGNLDEAGDKMVKLSEIKISIATAIAAAFGFIIALIWKEIIIGLMVLADMWQEGGPTTWENAGIAIFSAVIITLVCIFGIIYISKWAGIEKK